MKRYYVNRWNQMNFRYRRSRALKKAYMIISEVVNSCYIPSFAN